MLKVGVIHSVRAVVCCSGTVPSLLVIKRFVHVLVVCLLTCWFLLVLLTPGVVLSTVTLPFPCLSFSGSHLEKFVKIFVNEYLTPTII